MRIATYQVFDQQISGNATTWYSSAEYNRLLGDAEQYAIQAYTTNVPAGTWTLKVQSEYSADNQNWLVVAPAEISSATMTNNGSLYGFNLGLASNLPTPFVRLGITLGGATPSCRLKLYFTGHGRSRRG